MDRLIELLPKLGVAAWETVYMVGIAMVVGGTVGLALGLGLYLTRSGNLLENRVVFTILNVLINFFRPIPFVILLAAVQPLGRIVVGTGIGNPMAIFGLVVGSMFAIGRIVEQNLLTVQPGVIEAARSVGAGRLRIIGTVLIPEALGPLVLGYTFIVIAVTDMSAIAGVIGGGGLGNFAIQYGYRLFEPVVTWATVLIIIVLVQFTQVIGNVLARRFLRR
ncbi:methionine ABC transporter permease [Galbitalea sp. SE-J8]|uniref:methionine ABC transporter permease n=1 Tax=Galbitalea sp. SE-J8 TaxID=3054952 RepID=UPI00259CD5B7|nr:methionine ABC transporter permease [Galbitalea sp. SE-J8]MDM4761621.1 methionine ABC transporter permease [Galbitalea sp. SE-J8]